MKLKFIAVLIIAVVIFAQLGCNKNVEYQVNNNPPDNVRGSFYKKSVEILNYYTNNINTRSFFKEEDNEYLLGYYRSTPSGSTEETMIKTSLTYLDLIYRDFDLNLKGNKDKEMKINIKDFNEKLQETLKLLEIKKR